MKKRLSISDIAKNLGISVTTVSFILNDKAKEKRISDALTHRVLDYVKKVGYKPNQLAKSLRTGKSKTLGLLVEDISNTFFANIAKQIEQRAYDHGYHILYCSMNNDVNRAKELIQLFHDRQIDGFIIAPTEGLSEVIHNLLKNNVPIVLFDRFIEDLDTNYVVSENKQAAYMGSKYLLDDLKATKVGMLTINSAQTQMRSRLDGYMQAMDELGRDAVIKKIQVDQPDEVTIDLVRDFIVDNKLDAVFFATNYIAIIGLKAIKKYKLSIDKIVSFDDHAIFSLFHTPVTSLAQDIKSISDHIIQILISEINGKSKGYQHIVIPCELKVRN
ncbi:LacI family DNA-binding transcriptional regulator [Sphingobacterium pedocola]|uniref:LacI family transcriptional regulator n=1 Tax=Sphingobacterium pedocola TaxID=2082722 RepID=A0ABR9T3Y6_9SPHI|nr:LacI family DNA-binding transcriptional regulator [Sphingobacterium pedocola]MBE8720062.1 LacI family transcriptional regulator [Sphingobacterium pedocola]